MLHYAFIFVALLHSFSTYLGDRRSRPGLPLQTVQESFEQCDSPSNAVVKEVPLTNISTASEFWELDCFAFTGPLMTPEHRARAMDFLLVFMLHVGTLWGHMIGLPVRGFLIGSFSATFGGLCSYPLDIIRVRMQTRKVLKQKKAEKVTKDVTALEMAGKIWRKSGVGGFYHGVSASVVRHFVFSGTRFALYNRLKLYLPSRLMAGVVAGVCGAICASPVEVALVRVQVGISSVSMLATILGIVEQHGPSELFAGLKALCLRASIVTASQYAGKEIFEDLLKAIIGLREGVVLHILTSMLAGVLTATVINPVEILKTRLQTGKVKYATYFQLVQRTVEEEGIWSLNYGLDVGLARMLPYATAMLVTSEYLARFIKD